MPYHLGQTCEEAAAERKRPRCRFCTEAACDEPPSDGVVCSAYGCREKRKRACDKRLKCGHFCGGLKGHPCLQKCVRCSGEDCVTCASPLFEEPAVVLGCGHTFHVACARDRMGLPDEFSDTFLKCPLCAVPITASAVPALAAEVERGEAFVGEVRRAARARMRADGRHRDDAVRPGGQFDGRPAEYALTLYTFYRCETCDAPYFGGLRACGDGGAGAAGDERRCGPCAAAHFGAKCGRGHGDANVEWKCRFCCNVATWFCFGTTHMCETCHSLGPNAAFRGPLPCDKRVCPLGGRHPPNGTEHCLGCGVCRAGGAAGTRV